MWLFSYGMYVELHFSCQRQVKKIVLDHLIHLIFICVKEFDRNIFMVIIIRPALR